MWGAFLCFQRGNTIHRRPHADYFADVVRKRRMKKSGVRQIADIA
jgi:hypothetical protein